VETTTPSGLIVREHRRAAETPQIDPSGHDPNPNDPAVGSVGPQFAPGRNVMYPAGGWHAEGWDGWPVEWNMPWFGDAWSGPGVGRFNSELAGRLTTVGNCTDLIGRALSTMPIVVTQESRPIRRQPGWTINPEPLVYRNRAEWVKATVNSLLYRGETFQVATHRNAEDFPDRWVAMNPDALDVDGTPGEMEFRIAGRDIDPRDVLHVRHQMWPSTIRGVGPLEWAASSVLGASALERMASQLATRGGVPWAVITHPDELDDRQSGDLQIAWISAATSRQGAPAVLSGGISLQPLTLSPKDMALLELRVFDEQRICGAFGVFPILVNLDQPGGSLIYTNITQLFEAFWRQTLEPIAVNISSAISGWALPRTTDCLFDSEKYIRPPMAERANAYSTLFNIVDPATGQRAIEVEEIRAIENFGDADVLGITTSGTAP
jgi:HK97 family phage portal protein